MDQRIKELYNQNILQEVTRRYGINPSNLKALDGFESFIYEFNKDGADYILKVSHSIRRSAELLLGELEWVNYLAENGVSIAKGIPAGVVAGTKERDLVQTIPDGQDGFFTSVLLEKVQGTFATKDTWQPKLFKKLGQVMGKTHRLTKDYKPASHATKRHEWYEETVGFAEKYLPASEQGVIAKFNQLHEYLHSLPTDRDVYGLIHADMHSGNFFINDGEIILFDTDDCQYSWFANDIAISFFYAISHNCVTSEDIERAESFYYNFMDGYSKENTLEAQWLQLIPRFLKFRELDLYIIINRSFDLNNLSSWCQSFMTDRKYKIENDVPYVELDFVR